MKGRYRISSPLYNTNRWRKLRQQWLAHQPHCRFCQNGTVGRVVDHIVPHKGNEELFWNTNNLQTLCQPCHDRVKQKIERRKNPPTPTGVDGYPEGW